MSFNFIDSGVTDRCLAMPESAQRPLIDMNDFEQCLNELATICGESLSLSSVDTVALKVKLNEHTGQRATYSSKSALIDGLKHLHYHLSNREKPLTESLKLSFAVKLNEGVIACTTGLHDRVNEILSGLYLPESIDSLLLQIRQSIVFRAASKATDEVHCHNRFSVVAASLGYGVEPINPHDVYRGDLDDESIRNSLRTAFNANFTIPIILNEIIEGMKGILRNQYAYTGQKSDGNGYHQDMTAEFFNYLGRVLKPIEITPDDFFIPDGDDVDCAFTKGPIDINWNKVKQTLLQILLEHQYFNLREDKKTCLQYLVLMLGEKNYDSCDVRCLFEQGSLVNTPKELTSLLSFLDTTSREIQRSLILSFIECMPASGHGFTEITTWAIQIGCCDEVVNAWLKKANDICWKIILKTRVQPVAVASVLANIQQRDLAEKTKILTQITPNGRNALMIAASNQPESSVASLLECIQQLPKAKQITVLTQRTLDGYNALMLAARYQPNAVASLLAGIKHLDPLVQFQVLNQTSLGGYNALMIAAQYQPNAVASLLAGIQQLYLDNQITVLTQTTRNGDNALMLAAQFQPNAVVPLLAGIRHLAPDEIITVLTQTSLDGNNALMLAVRYQPNAVVPLLTGIQQLAPLVQFQVLNQTSLGGWKALMLAAGNQPDIFKKILELLNRFEHSTQFEILKNKDVYSFGSVENTICFIEHISNMPNQHHWYLLANFKWDSFLQYPEDELDVFFSWLTGREPAYTAMLLSENTLMSAVDNPSTIVRLIEVVETLERQDQISLFNAFNEVLEVQKGKFTKKYQLEHKVAIKMIKSIEPEQIKKRTFGIFDADQQKGQDNSESLESPVKFSMLGG